jgi:lysophospholipid hydrolase
MSYAWILPPICDPRDGHLLMDGCYVNNVPGDVMLRESSCSHIIAVDVTAIDSTDLENYGDSLSGWRLLWNRLNPFAAPLQIPTQAQIQERLTFVSHYRNLEQLKNNPKYEYIQPPVGHFSSAKFDGFEVCIKLLCYTIIHYMKKSGC